jgi:diadenosine tetraphosphatase ApaH/serine/threonine PP2A family protein phosphatase
MRYGVLSDIHSNLEALQAALDVLSSKGAEGWIVLGDSVGYGADPNACLERLALLEPAWIVSGNHDLACLGRMDLEWFNSIAADAIRWTRKTLTDSSRRFLEELPLRVDHEKFTAVHGSPRSPSEEYLLTPGQFLENLQYFKVSPCFVGHSHLPLYFESLGGEEVRGEIIEGERIFAAPAAPCALNPGSVGQPRDMDPRGCCGLFDDKVQSFEWIRVPYPVETTQQKIVDAGLPSFLAERLAMGR